MEGWNSLVDLAQERDRQNEANLETNKGKRKGTQELHNLACSINYEKSCNRQSVGSGKGDRSSNGDVVGNS